MGPDVIPEFVLTHPDIGEYFDVGVDSPRLLKSVHTHKVGGPKVNFLSQSGAALLFYSRSSLTLERQLAGLDQAGSSFSPHIGTGRGPKPDSAFALGPATFQVWPGRAGPCPGAPGPG